MGNIEVDVYLSVVKSFFEKNDELLIKIIGDMSYAEFFDKIRDVAYKNYQKSGDPTLTIKQLESISTVSLKILPEESKIVKFSVSGKNFKFSSN